MLNLLLLGLATWRLSSLLVNESGPWDMFASLRHMAGVRFDDLSQPYAESMLGNMLMCVWCSSLWVGLGFGLAYLFLPILVWAIPAWALALSTLAIAIQKIMDNNFQFREDAL
jgi:hypothetical protein